MVSGEAERDFEKGYHVNLAGTQALFEAIRLNGMRHNWVPRVVYASSNAVFGGDFPDVIPDDFHLTPQTSYGVQKAIGELLLQNYSRKGFSMGSASACPRSPCDRAGPMPPHPVSSPVLFGSLLSGRRRSCLSVTRRDTG
ncbi:MAG: NAD-dependent epimerase/dehydratase family protein [Acetobacteraceae bacterium]